jgi:hypothetical protein
VPVHVTLGNQSNEVIMCRPCAPQVKRHLYGWVRHFNLQIEGVRVQKGCALSDIPLALIARGILGRPNVDPNGPTRLEVAPPLLNTDTKSYTDIISIMAHLDRMYLSSLEEAKRSGGYVCDGLSPAVDLSGVISIDVSDGQSVKLQAHQMRKHPAAHRNRVPVDGPMHA